jgi:hypothetical protein
MKLVKPLRDRMLVLPEQQRDDVTSSGIVVLKRTSAPFCCSAAIVTNGVPCGRLRSRYRCRVLRCGMVTLGPLKARSRLGVPWCERL